MQRTKLGWDTLESDAEEGFRKRLGRSSVSSVEPLLHACHSLAELLLTVVWFGLVLQVLSNKILLYRFAGCAHWNGPESYSKPTFAAEGKGNPVGVPRLGQHNRARASHLPLKTLSPLLPNRFRLAGTGSYSLIKAAALEQNYSGAFGIYGGPQRSLSPWGT